MSGRDPCTKILRELGSGLTAATSTCASCALNLGLATMTRLSTFRRSGGRRGDCRRSPTAGLTASGSKGLSHPELMLQDPHVVRTKVLQDACGDNAPYRAQSHLV